MSYPDKFQFAHENTTQLYNMTRLAGTAQPLWACTRGDEEGYSASPLYNEFQIQDNFDNGYWQEISSSEPNEPEMVFPFNFTVLGYEETNGEYTMYKDQVGVSWVKCADWETTQPDLYSEEEMRRFIEEGKWRVTSVGEQPPKEEIFDANKKENFKESTRLSFGKLEDLTVTLKADTTDAVVDMQNATLVAINLAQAVENVVISLQSLQALLNEMGLGRSGSEDCSAFCCGD